MSSTRLPNLLVVGFFSLIFLFGAAPLSHGKDIALEAAARKLDRLVERNDITSEQGKLMYYLLQDEHYMIDLFRQHGGLSTPALQQKIRDILDVTQFRIDSILTDEQKARWNAWTPAVIRRVRDTR